MAITHNDTAGLLNISIDHDDIEKLIHGVLSPAAMKRVQTRAINETTAWMRSRLLRELPGITGIPRKIMSRRARVGKAKSGSTGVTGKVWLGLRPVDAMALKDGGAVNTGYESGGFFFEGGFKSTMRNGKEGIFSRTSDKRFPIRRQNVRIDSFANQVIGRIIPQAERQLMQKMTRLVSYELELATR